MKRPRVTTTASNDQGEEATTTNTLGTTTMPLRASNGKRTTRKVVRIREIIISTNMAHPTLEGARAATATTTMSPDIKAMIEGATRAQTPTTTMAIMEERTMTMTTDAKKMIKQEVARLTKMRSTNTKAVLRKRLQVAR